MNKVTIRFDEDLSKLINDDYDPATSPVTQLLGSGEPLVIDTSLEIINLHCYKRQHNFTVPVLSILKECCGYANVPYKNIHWITPVAQYEFDNKIVFNGTLEAYHEQRGTAIGFTHTITKNFLSLNGCPRPHRTEIVKFLEDTGISKKSFYSYNPRQWNGGYSVVLDQEYTKGHIALDKINCTPAYIWQESFISIVTETVFNEAVCFPTEKTWKVFDKYHLPIFVSCAGFVAHIRSLGFDVFDDLIDHSYDDIDNDTKRMQAVTNEITVWAAREIDVLSKAKYSLRKRLEYNKSILHALINTEINKRDEKLRSML